MRVIDQIDSVRMLPGRIWYLYGFRIGEPEAPVDIGGLDKSGPVQAFTHAGLNAYISQVARETFTGEEAQARLRDIAWLTHKARLHQQILDALMRDGGLFPAPFGTVFSSLTKLAEVMERERQRIAATLQHLRGRREWGVQIGMDKPAAVAARMNESMRRQPQPTPSTPGVAHLRQQRLKRCIERDMDTWLSQWQAQMLRELEPLSDGFRDRKRLLLEDLLCNWAFLVPDEGRAAFFEKIRYWQTKGERYGLQIHLKGPWPPYSFCANMK